MNAEAHQTTDDTEEAAATEPVALWRYLQLHAAGYPDDIAWIIADRHDLDLHHACELLKAGASVRQAEMILL